MSSDDANTHDPPRKPPASLDGPAEVKETSRKARILTSWKLWVTLLVLGLLGIGAAFTMPYVHRLRALRYFDLYPHQGEYRLSEDHEDWPEQYGEWVNSLREVDSLRITGANDESLAHASALHDARLLAIVASPERPVSNRGLSQLPPFERLEQLALAGPGFTDESVARILSSRPPLTRAVLFDTGFGPLTNRALAECTSVQELMILGRTLNDDDFQNLGPFPELVYFASTGVGDDGAERIAQFPKVEFIFLMNSTVTSAGLERLSECASLSTVMLHGSPVTDDELAEFLSSKELTQFGVVACPQLTAEGITRWPDLPHLTTLTLSPNLLTQESIARLKEMPELNQIEVWGTVADPELRQAIEDTWPLFEQPLTDETLWQVMRGSVLNFINVH